MKKMLTALSIAILLPAVAVAGGKDCKHGKDGKRDHMKHMAKELNLTDEQRSQVHDIMQKHMEAGRLEIRDTLNDEQRVKFDQLHEERKQRMQEREAKRAERQAARASKE